MKITDDFDSAAAKVAGQLSTDPIDQAAGEVVQAQKVQAKASLYNALLQNPEMAARAQKLGRRTGLPSEVVSRNLPEVERTLAVNDIDKMLDTNPAVVQFLTSPSTPPWPTTMWRTWARSSARCASSGAVPSRVWVWA